MSPIKDLFLSFEAVNADRVFSEGVILTGTLALTLSKDTRVKTIFVKVKGDARVRWSDGETAYIGHIRYFKLKQYLETENGRGTALSKGVHLFKFTFQIPHGDMPSSFKKKHGSIVYMLEAKVTRSWRWPSTAKAEFNLVSNSLRYSGLTAMAHSVEKMMGKRAVQLHVVMNRKACSPGYHVKSEDLNCTKRLGRIVGDSIAPKSDKTVSWQMTIPTNAIYTINNCDLISVLYYVKVYLDISFAIDPEVVIPLVVIPASFAQLEPGEAERGPSDSDFPPSAYSAEYNK